MHAANPFQIKDATKHIQFIHQNDFANFAPLTAKQKNNGTATIMKNLSNLHLSKSLQSMQRKYGDYINLHELMN